ncbi:GspH/FimT family pseudopilin [Stenotrophomonas cyclobalanopsidis]|uniref:GspH/FimT family pseudopilin n=1 Tax=Stenotrophomonas cyclobalanopsidis TaxID=2771362 RepID=UPI0034612197
MARPAPHNTGLSLPECLAVLSVLAVLAALTLPALNPLLNNLRADALRMTLHTSLNRARYEAITRREMIGVCPSADGLQCSQDWSKGWIMYRSGIRRRPPTSAADVLEHHQERSGLQLSAHATEGRPQLFFHADGRSPGANATLRICHGGRQLGQVVINNGGRTRSARILTPTPC